MLTHLQREIEQLKQKILAQAAKVEEEVLQALRAVEIRDAVLAQRIVDDDAAIDYTEVNIEEDCLKILALYQPVATDLRFIITVLKANNDLERIGDLAAHIAERALSLCGQPPVAAPYDLDQMRAKSLAMLQGSLDALMRQDSRLARRVRASDDEVDAINREIFAKISAELRRQPEHILALISHLSVSRHLERIADHAANIAEDVIYLVEGEIVRHKPAPAD